MTKRLEILGTIAPVIAVAGVLANNYRLRACFVAWLLSNGLTAYLHLRQRMWSLLMRDVIFLGLAVQGLILKEHKGNPPEDDDYRDEPGATKPDDIKPLPTRDLSKRPTPPKADGAWFAQESAKLVKENA